MKPFEILGLRAPARVCAARKRAYARGTRNITKMLATAIVSCLLYKPLHLLCGIACWATAYWFTTLC